MLIKPLLCHSGVDVAIFLPAGLISGIIRCVQTNSQVNCGSWRLVREIGHGAYGTVYLAERDDGERVAVKVCRCDDIGGERYARELRGAKLYSSIPPQEGLVHMREFAEKPWGFYAVMDLADDEFDGNPRTFAEYHPKTLARVIDGEKALPLGESVKLGIALAKGLAALQRHHLLHRDIKPANVLYFKGRPVLSDPGLVVEEGDAVSTVGTPIYVPPEGRFTEPASDIYSLGLTLKAASFGRRIEELDKGPALEADTGAKLFPAWWRILNKATAPSPSRRYQSAKALLKDLENLRRKIAVASIVGSRAAIFAIAALALAVIATIVPIVTTSRRAKHDLVRQSVETKSLREGLARQSAENKLLKDDLARQSKENKSLKDDLVKQSEEIKALKSDLVRQPEERKTLKDALDRQSEESKTLKDALDRQSEENKSLKADLAKQSKEIKVLKDDLAKQPEESKSLRDALDRQSEENKSLKADLARQSEENRVLKEGLARQSAEIKSLKDDIARQPLETRAHDADFARQSKEIEQLKKFKTDTEKMFARAERETLWPIYLWTNSRDYQKNLYKSRINSVAETNQTCAAEMRSRLARIEELDKSDKALLKRIQVLYKTAEGKIKEGLDDEEEYLQAKKIHVERCKIGKEINSICKEL